MASNDDWRELSVSEFAEVIGGTTPSTSISSHFGGDVPWITPKDLSNFQGRYISRGERNITREGVGAARLQILPKGTVLLSTRAPIGYVAIAANALTTNQGFRNLVVKSGFEPEYVFYLLKQNTDRLKSFASGTTFGELSGSTLKRLRFSIPPLSEQRAIAHVLGSLDDKIEFNRRMNQTLEEICRALFKFWFVDFGPVRAKMEGRWKKGESLPGMPADMWDLWPSELEESEIGKIPKGWFVQQLADVAEILQGSTPNTEVSGYWDPPEHHWVTVKDLSQTQDYVLIGTDRKVSQKGLEYLGSRVVPPRSILLSTGAPIGYVAITTVQTVLGTRVVALQPQSQLGQSYLFHWVKTSVGAFRDAANGTTFPQLLLSTLREFPILAPSAQVLSRFESLLSPIQARVISNVAESSSLAATRDTLLPKLLSGEIRVKVDS